MYSNLCLIFVLKIQLRVERVGVNFLSLKNHLKLWGMENFNFQITLGNIECN